MSFLKNKKDKSKIEKTPSFLKKIWKIRSISILILGGLLINVLGWIFLRWQINCDQSTMILHYNSFLGIDVIDFDFRRTCYQIFFVSLSGLVIWLINTILGVMLVRQADFFSAKKNFKKDLIEKKIDEKIIGGYLLWISSFIIQLIIFVYILAIIVVNK